MNRRLLRKLFSFLITPFCGYRSGSAALRSNVDCNLLLGGDARVIPNNIGQKATVPKKRKAKPKPVKPKLRFWTAMDWRIIPLRTGKANTMAQFLSRTCKEPFV